MIKRIDLSPHDAYFFGCWRGLGHHLWAPGMQELNGEILWGPKWTHMDGGYAIRSKNGITRYLAKNDPVPEGWTVFTMNDFTVDTRPGSHATFAVKGILSEDDALAILRLRFPEVMQRLVQTGSTRE